MMINLHCGMTNLSKCAKIMQILKTSMILYASHLLQIETIMQILTKKKRLKPKEINQIENKIINLKLRLREDNTTIL